MEIVFLIAYIVVGLLMIWPAQQWLLIEVCGTTDRKYLDWADLFFSGLLGCLAAILWPVFLTGFIAVRISKRIWTRFLDNENGRISNERTKESC